MKLLILIGLMISMPAFAVKAPSYLENGRIKLSRPGGVDHVSSDEYALVKRANLTKYKNLSAAPECTKVIRTRTITRTLMRRNLVLFHAGIGQNGVIIDRGETDYLLIKQKTVPVVGASYLRHIKSGYSIGGSAFTSNTFTLSAGYSF